MDVLAKKVAIVTGASSGIGRATARLFAGEGARVVVSGRRSAELDALVSDIEAEGGQAIAVPGDIKHEQVAKALVDTAVDRFGGLDIAFNNAGMVGEIKPITEMSLDAWHEMLDTNLASAFLGAKYQVPAMLARGGGSLIFTSSFVGYTAGLPGMAAYAASKAGQIGLVKALAAEYGPKGIRVNAVLPGGTDTPASLTHAPDANGHRRVDTYAWSQGQLAQCVVDAGPGGRGPLARVVFPRSHLQPPTRVQGDHDALG